MPFYRYTAQDATGKTISGALEATTPDAAALRLTGMGLARVAVEGASPVAAMRTAVSPTPSQPVALGRATGGSVHDSRSVATSDAFDESERFRIVSPRERSFFFDQLGRFIHSGISGSKALETLADQAGGKKGEFLRDAARQTASGIGLGESLRGGYITAPERDAITAGERGGYVPEACRRLGDLALDSHKLGRGYLYPLFLLCFALFSGPCTFATQNAALKSIELQDKAGGTLPPIGTVTKEMGRAIPIAFLQGGLILFGLWGAFRLWNLPANRVLRHRMSLYFWPLGPRARSEATAQLATHLAALSSAAIPTHEATRLAAATIPNLALRAEAGRALGSIPVGSPLSGAIARTNLVSTQYKHLVENGEMTGDVPGALAQVARVEEGELKNRSSFARRALGVIGLLVAGIVIVIIVGHAETAWYSRFIDAMLKTD